MEYVTSEWFDWAWNSVNVNPRVQSGNLLAVNVFIDTRTRSSAVVPPCIVISYSAIEFPENDKASLKPKINPD